MSNEKILTNNNYNVIFHPFLLKTFITKKNEFAIIPKYIDSDIIDNHKNFSNNSISFDNILSVSDINDYFTSNLFFLSANLQINSIDDIFQKLDELIISNRKLETVDFIVNIILHEFKDQFDDILIDKLIDFYQKYFNNFFSKQIEYKVLFKQLQQVIETKTITPHTDTVNNILKK